MSKVLVEEGSLANIASAIRGKNGLSTLYKPSEMAAAVAAIPTGIIPTGSVMITQNGTVDVTQYASANVNVPNSYAASDEGKVVNNGALVAQGSRTIAENGAYDTTLDSAVVVNVGGGGVTSPFYILNPTKMDSIASVTPQMQTGENSSVLTNAAIASFAPFAQKINNLSADARKMWISRKATYNGVSGTACFGRYGDDRSGLIFTTKIPGGAYETLHIRFEITTGRYSGAYFKLYLQSDIGFSSSDVYPSSTYTLYSEQLANSLIADNTQIIDISNITSDFYIGFGDYSGFTKIRGLWLEA